MPRPSVQGSRFFSPQWAVTCREAALLLILAAVATTATWAVRNDRLPLGADRDFYELESPAPVVEIPRALVLFEEGDRLFIDTRSDLTQGMNTILGAFRIRAAFFDDDLYELVDIVYPEDPVLLFGSGDLRKTILLAELLLARGFEDVLVMRGTVAGWHERGGEISTFVTESSTDPEEES